MNLFPASAAILLRERSWLSDTAITNWLRNYGKGGHSEGTLLLVNSSIPGIRRYRIQYVHGLWRFESERY